MTREEFQRLCRERIDCINVETISKIPPFVNIYIFIAIWAEFYIE